MDAMRGRLARLGPLEDQAVAALTRVIEWAIDMDPSDVRSSLMRLRAAHPEASPRELAKIAIERTRLRTTAVGVGTGLPAGLLLSAGAGFAEAAVVLRSHAVMVAQIAECLVPGFLDEPDARSELLVPIMGPTAAVKALHVMGMPKDEGPLTREMARRHLRGGRGKALGNWLIRGYARYLAKKVGVTKLLPLLGGLLSGGWNFAETSVTGRRAVEYFGG